jgi:hypothetical protein
MGKESFFGRVKNMTQSMFELQGMQEDAVSVAIEFTQGKIDHDTAIGKLCEIAVAKKYRIRDLKKLFDEEVLIFNKFSRDKYR